MIAAPTCPCHNATHHSSAGVFARGYADARIARHFGPSPGKDRARGAVAQLGERRVRNAKVEGSIPFRSTIYPVLVKRPDHTSVNLGLQRFRIAVASGSGRHSAGQLDPIHLPTYEA